MSNTQFQIDPIGIDDELEIEVLPIEEVEKPTDIDDEIVNETEDGFFDSDDSDDSDVEKDDDSDEEEKPVVKKTIKPKTEKRVNFNDEIIRRKPSIGNMYKAKNFSIEIVAKRGNKYDCKVLSVIPPSRREKGEIFEAEEIAFYSEYYEYAGTTK
jgi:hypothetical protein